MRSIPLPVSILNLCQDKKNGGAFQRMVDTLTKNFGNLPGQTRLTRVDIDFYQQVCHPPSSSSPSNSF